MWIMSRYGYFEAVRYRDEDDYYVVKTGSLRDLTTLHKVAQVESEIDEFGDVSYAAQMVITTGEFFRVMNRLAESVSYDDLRTQIAAMPDQKDKIEAYEAVSSTMWKWQDGLDKPTNQFWLTDTRYDVRFKNSRLLAGAEGGSLDVAEYHRAYYALIHDCLKEDSSTRILEFDSRETRKRHLARVYGQVIKHWKQYNPGELAW